MLLTINGISYFIEIHQQDKSKSNLLLLHGFMGSGRVFGELIPKLKDFYNPITVDLLGHGKTDGAYSAERFQTSKQVRDLTSIIGKVSADPIYLYGYSMGGRLALQFAVKNHHLLQGLILESTNPGLKNKQERRERIQTDKERTEAIKTDFQSFLKAWKTLPLFNTGTSDKNGLAHYHQIQKKQNPQQMAYSLLGFGTGQMPYIHFNKINILCLLIAGKKDEKYVDIMRGMSQQNSKSTLEIISNAGHRVHLYNPIALTGYMKKFVE